MVAARALPGPRSRDAAPRQAAKPDLYSGVTDDGWETVTQPSRST